MQILLEPSDAKYLGAVLSAAIYLDMASPDEFARFQQFMLHSSGANEVPDIAARRSAHAFRREDLHQAIEALTTVQYSIATARIAAAAGRDRSYPGESGGEEQR